MKTAMSYHKKHATKPLSPERLVNFISKTLQERPAQKTAKPSRERRASKRACPLFQTDLPAALRLPQSLFGIAG
ncbi:hypothetical protein [Desulfovibrio sp. ZJ200]|uniref:hypothetical protein n=1 Tax=Desulfovibrio sp. ZJ200 TaxID=2709792 RepID=UPI0013EDEF87|nr:hypothetical protein [Desulfovibrio sp. ZJ200]